MHRIKQEGVLKALILTISLCILHQAKAASVLIVGDSMGQYMGKTLQSICLGTEVQNAAIGGTTADDWASYTSDVLKGCKGGTWDVVYIAVGGNDFLKSRCALSVQLYEDKVFAAVTNIIDNVAPKASKYLLTGYCMPSTGICSNPSEFIQYSAAYANLIERLPDVEIVNPVTTCGGSTSSFSDSKYFQDSIHLNSKGYCKVFTQSDVTKFLSCGENALDCNSPGFEIHGLNQRCTYEKPETTNCRDKTTWKHKSKVRTCAWVAKKPGKRCESTADDIKASSACPIACNNKNAGCIIPECRDDWTVTLNNGKEKNCKYLNRKKKKTLSTSRFGWYLWL